MTLYSLKCSSYSMSCTFTAGTPIPMENCVQGISDFLSRSSEPGHIYTAQNPTTIWMLVPTQIQSANMYACHGCTQLPRYSQQTYITPACTIGIDSMQDMCAKIFGQLSSKVYYTSTGAATQITASPKKKSYSKTPGPHCDDAMYVSSEPYTNRPPHVLT
jgi:hypothetical protein